MTDAGLLHVAYGCPALHSQRFSATGIADWGVRRPVVLAGPLPGARVVVAAAGAKGWRGGVKAAGAVGAEARAACNQMAARCWLGRWVALGGALGDNFVAGTVVGAWRAVSREQRVRRDALTTHARYGQLGMGPFDRGQHTCRRVAVGLPLPPKGEGQ